MEHRAAQNDGMAKSVSRPRTPWYAAEWLNHLHMKQSDIVESTGLSKSLVSAYISGKRRWNTEILRAFADAMRIAPAELLAKPKDLASPAKQVSAMIEAMEEERQYQALEIVKVIIKTSEAVKRNERKGRQGEQEEDNPFRRRTLHLLPPVDK